MESRLQRQARLAREAFEYASQMAALDVEEQRRTEAWEADTSSSRPSFFVPYGLGWERYAGAVQ